MPRKPKSAEQDSANSELASIPEDLGGDDASIVFLSLVAREAFKRGRLDDATKAVRAIAQIRGAIGPGSEARTKEVSRLGTAQLEELARSLAQ